MEKIQKVLLDGKPARSATLTDFEKDAIKHLCLLTMKPVIYVANVAESDIAEPASNPHVKEVMGLASELQSGIVTVSAQVGWDNLLSVLNISPSSLNPFLQNEIDYKSSTMFNENLNWGASYFQVESELSELPSEERFEYLKSLGVSESGLGNLIRATYNLLGLRTYFTSGEKVGFWTITLVFVFQSS